MGMGKRARVASLAIVIWAGLLWGDEPSTAEVLPGPVATPATIFLASGRREGGATGVLKYGLTRSDFRRITQTIPGIRQTVATREMNKRARYGDRLEEVCLVGTTPPFSEFREIRIQRGRFLVEKDVKLRANVAVIGHTVAQRVFPGRDPIGKSISIEGAYYLVVGVITKGSGSNRQAATNVLSNSDHDVYIPLTTMWARLGDIEITWSSGTVDANHCELSRIEITVADVAQTGKIAEMVSRVLRESHEEQDYMLMHVER